MHNPTGGRREGIDVDIYHIKDPEEPWNDKIKERLTCLGPDSQNLDGHTFEYYRKILDKRPETDKVLLYYTDGKMPAENHDEELEILTREIRVCRHKKYALVGVGIRTDSPVRHGLDTVRIDSVEDVVKVVRHLEKVLLAI
jgi:nitric oxide reductase activation protein